MVDDSPFAKALELLVGLDAGVLQVVGLSLTVSGLATACAAALGLPAALALGLGRFPGRRPLRALVRSLMMFPRCSSDCSSTCCGPRERDERWSCCTPPPIVLAQTALAFPLVTALFVAAFESVDPMLLDAVRTTGAGRWWVARAAVRQAAPGLFAAALTGFARVIGETGMTMMVGGNILGRTRTMTTSIATESMRGEFETAIALGLVLLLVSVGVNVVLTLLEPRADARAR